MSKAKPKLPWPADAVMMVCASPTTYRREQMESVHEGHCRMCTHDIVYDGRTMRRALEIAGGKRPVKFFCMDCAAQHDVNQCGHIVDHSGGKNVEYGPRRKT